MIPWPLKVAILLAIGVLVALVVAAALPAASLPGAERTVIIGAAAIGLGLASYVVE